LAACAPIAIPAAKTVAATHRTEPLMRTLPPPANAATMVLAATSYASLD
jgi:hypothetical protein